MRRIVNVLALTVLVSALFALPASAQALVASASADTQAGPPPLQVQFSGSASGGQAPYFYSWNFGDGSNPTTLQNPGHTFSAMGTYTVTLTVTDIDLETATDTLTIAVSEALTVVPSASVMSGPAPLGVRFSTAVTGGVPPYTYFWDFQDGYSDQEDPWFVFADPGVYGVQVRVTDSQGAYAYGNLSITVSPGQGCQAWQAATSSTQKDIWGMAYGAGRFVGATWGAMISSPNGTSWSMVHDDVVYDMNDVAYNGQVWVAVGNYVTGVGGTLLSSTDGVTWYEGGISESNTLRGITWGNGLFVAVGNAGAIFVSPDGSEWQKVHFEFGDTTLNDVIWNEDRHQFVAVGATGAVRTSSDGYIWEVHDWPLTIAFSAVAWNGERYVAVGFAGSVPIGGEVYTSSDGEAWEFRGASFVEGLVDVEWSGSRFVTVGFLDREAGGIYSSRDGMTWVDYSQGLSAIPQLLCIAPHGDEWVAAGMRGGLVYNPGTAGCLLAEPTVTPQTGIAPVSAQFVANVTGGTPPYRYRWSFGDGSADAFVENPSHTYAQAGEFTATLHAIDASDRGIQTNVAVRPVEPLTATQVTANPTTGMAPLTVQFSASGTGGLPPYVYTWDFGDGSPKERGSQVSHLYSEGGSYQARVTIQDTSGLTLVSDPIELEFLGALTASSSGTPLAGTYPLSVQFQGSALGGQPPYAYTWAFGDGQSSTAQNPRHTYATAGAFQAILTVKDANGFTDSADPITVYANQPLVVTATATPPLGAIPLSVQFTATITGGMEPYTVTWNFGDGTTGTGASAQHAYTSAGDYPVSVTVLDGAGVTASDSHLLIPVTTPLVATATGSPESGEEPLTVQFRGTAAGGRPPYTYSWDFGDQSGTDARLAPSHLFEKRGNYTVTFSLRDSLGQVASANLPIEVAPAKPKLLWRFTADTSLVHIPTVGPDGSVYVGGGNAHIYGISPSGQQMWKKKPGGTLMAPMAFYRGNLYFPTSNQRLMAYASGGAKLWEVKLEANATSSPAISECGDVYLGATDGHLYAAGGGGGLKWKLKTAGPIESTPAVAHDGIIFVVANGSSVPGYAATLYAVRSSGGIWWEYPDLLVNPVRLPLVLDADDNIFITDSAGLTTVVPPTKTTPPPDPRSVLWQGSGGPASPIIAGNYALYSDAGTTRTVQVADGTDGPWSAPYGAAIAPAVSSDGKVYVVQNIGGGEAYLVSLDMADGAELSTSKLSGGGRDPVLLSLNRRGRVYLIAADYNVECYGVPRGAATGPWVQYGGTPFHPARRSQSPTAFIASPPDGSTVSGSVAVQFGGTVDQACDGPKIHLYVEGYRLTTADASPAGFTWLTGASQNGNYTLTAECWDKAGNVAEASVNVSLSNPEPPTYHAADPIPTFSWQAQGDSKFRVYLSTDPEFGTILATSKTDQKPWLKSPGWTPSQKQWNKVLAAAGSSPVRVYWKAIGKTAGLVHLGSFYVAH